jgi:hypothetical protein
MPKTIYIYHASRYIFAYMCMYTSLCTNEADVRDVTGRSTRAIALKRGYNWEEEIGRER